MLFFIILIFSVVFKVNSEVPKFRVLSPEFICPKEDNEIPVCLDKPDITVITLQTIAGAELTPRWMVRWTPLAAQTQRFTLLLWRAVREVEKQLNKPPKEPLVYIINNDKLLRGVDYTFNVTVSGPDEDSSETKTFHIDNSQGDLKLDLIDGRGDLMSVVLIGGQTTFTDMTFMLYAQISVCHPTQDYYFSWSVREVDTQKEVVVPPAEGYKLEIPPHTLKAGKTYDVNCQVLRRSDDYIITKTGLPFLVSTRGLKVFLSHDNLLITVNSPFSIESLVINHDYYEETVSYAWSCSIEGEPCDNFKFTNNGSLTFSSGLSTLGRYQISLVVSVHEQSATTQCVVHTVEANLPVLQMSAHQRFLNEGEKMSLSVNASNVAPSCNFTWYFASTEEHLFTSGDHEGNRTGVDQGHGKPLTDTLTVYSLQENFLNELTDFTNETEWREIFVDFIAAPGRARFVAECGCSLTFNCDTKGVVYVDAVFQLNPSPKPHDIMILPETGTALVTVFRISTTQVLDAQPPLRYDFYCRVGINITVRIASYTDYVATDATLPYIDDGTELWVKVCDSLGACTRGSSITVHLSPGEGRSWSSLVEAAGGHARRCELELMKTVVVFGVATYTNAEQSEILENFQNGVKLTLEDIDQDCVENKARDYYEILDMFEEFGLLK